MQAADGPALDLSDIMHTMSPSPAPQTAALPSETQVPLPDAQLQPPHGNGVFALEQGGAAVIHVYDAQGVPSTPEPLDRPELDAMRQRVQHLGLTGPSPSRDATPLERELATMVLRLTSDAVLQPSPSQLASQAETIATLNLQRHLLLHGREEERALWDVERQGWDRTAEALLRQRRDTKGVAEKDHEAERSLARLRDENSALRHKLSDTNTRLSALESELSRLRPLLAVQSEFLRDPDVLQHATLLDFTAPNDNSDPKKARKSTHRVKKEDVLAAAPQTQGLDANAELVVGRDAIDIVPDMITPSARVDGQSTGETGVRPQDLTIAPEDTQGAGPSRRRLDSTGDVFVPPSQPSMPSALKASSSKHVEKHAKKSKDKRARFKAPGPRAPLLTDARAECILTAARKIGRVRAGIAAGLVRGREREERRAEAAKKAREEAQRTSGVVLGNHPDWQGTWVPSEGEAGPSNYQSAVAGPSAGTSTTATQARGVGVQHMHPSGPYQLTATPPQMRVAPGSVPAHPYPMPGFVYMQAVPSPPGGRAVPAQVPQGTAMMVPVWPMPGTPPAGRQQSQAPGPPQGRGGHAQTQGRSPVKNGRAQGPPATPLDSLLSAATAARTLMVDEDYDGDGDGVGGGAGDETEKEEEELPSVKRSPRRRSAASASALDRPVPKKRKVGASGSAGSTASTRGTTGRTRRQTRAALAQQAQEPQEQTLPRPPPDRKGKGKQRENPVLPPPAQTKGKGKATANGDSAQLTQLAPTPAPITRVRSALDVLADQAAQMPTSRPGSRRQSAEPDRDKERRRAGPGPSAMSKMQTGETLAVEEPEDPGPEEEEGVSDADAEGDVDADIDADADAEGSEDDDVVAADVEAAKGHTEATEERTQPGALQHPVSIPTPSGTTPTMSTRTRQIEPIDVGSTPSTHAQTSRRTDVSMDTGADGP